MRMNIVRRGPRFFFLCFSSEAYVNMNIIIVNIFNIGISLINILIVIDIIIIMMIPQLTIININITIINGRYDSECLSLILLWLVEKSGN